jgi:hypothetical protein
VNGLDAVQAAIALAGGGVAGMVVGAWVALRVRAEESRWWFIRYVRAHLRLEAEGLADPLPDSVLDSYEAAEAALAAERAGGVR